MFLGYVLNKSIFEPQKGWAGLGWTAGASFVPGLESFLGSFSLLLPTPSSFPSPNSLFKNLSCCFFNSACVWADVQERLLQQRQQQEQEKKPSTSIQCSLLLLALPSLSPGLSQLMIDNVLLSLTLGSTCLSIGQHSLCEATWESSH